ncbi:hypothetical protein QEZ40_006428 [Streptomyces katrae]|uniref:Uncharacterized protein n=1 Tax=Streptomyces katrae TaxID=68223 RepID=A0ABT7H3W6_9ACTN|nr:hypothetical protein [Streptomyces katrae]MDK9500600.1 hypothetical protein [Streptomyces katrae]
MLTQPGMLPAERSVAIAGINGLVGDGGFHAPEGLAAEPAGVLDDVAALVKEPLAA